MSTTDSPGLVETTHGAVRTLTIDRPARRNALDTPTIEAMIAAVRAAGEDPSVRTIVITGSGDVAFSAGIDLKEEEAPDLTPRELQARRTRLMDLFAAIDGSSRPVVTRLNGVAMGGGAGLALVADLVVAADHAVLCTPEIDVGRWPMAVGAVLLRAAPLRLATEMMMTGRQVSMTEALDHGLVNRVVPHADLDRAVAALTDVLVAKPPATMALGRTTIRQMLAMDLPQRLELAAARLADVIDNDEARAGLERFRDRSDG